MLTYAEAQQQLTKLEVQTEPVLDENFQTIPRYQLIRRLNDDCELTIVSDKYQVLQHSDALDMAISKINTLGLNAELTSVKTNVDYWHNSMHLTFTFPEISFDIDGSETNATLEVLNSTDGLMGYREFLGLYRIRCENGLIIGDDIFKSYRRHYGDSFHHDIDNVHRFEAALESYDKIRESIEISREVKASKEFINKLIKMGFPANLVMDNFTERFFNYADSYKEFMQSYTSVWAYYSVLTHWLSHTVAKTNIAREMTLSQKLAGVMLNKEF